MGKYYFVWIFNYPNSSFVAIESAYAIFQQDYLAYKLNKELAPYQIDLSAQNVETSQQHEQFRLLTEQKEIAQREFSLKIKN